MNLNSLYLVPVISRTLVHPRVLRLDRAYYTILDTAHEYGKPFVSRDIGRLVHGDPIRVVHVFPRMLMVDTLKSNIKQATG